MNWAECLVQCLKDAQISLVGYVPDANIDQPIRLMQQDPFFHVVTGTREEETIGIAVGAYAVGRNAAVFMQSSGFGNCLNAIGSLCIPFRVPIPLFIKREPSPSSDITLSWVETAMPSAMDEQRPMAP